MAQEYWFKIMDKKIKNRKNILERKNVQNYVCSI